MTGPPEDLDPVDILLVDDQPGNLASLEAILRQPDYNLVLAHSGAEALALVLRQEFAVILLDVAMPEMDGFETAEIIREREQSRLIPIIFVTASVYEMEHLFRGYTVGAVDYLRKPLDPHAVRAKVAVFVELFQQRRRNERQAKRLQEAEALLRARAEEALRESEAIYQATFEEAPVGIGHASPDGVWTKVNPKLGEILGRSHDALVGTHVAEIADDVEDRRLHAALEELRRGTAPSCYAGELRLVTPQHATWGHVTVSAMRDREGRVQRFVVVVADISERKAVEGERARLLQELRDGVRARDDFLAIAAHELKTPLTPLRLQTGGLLRELRRGADPARLLDGLQRRLEIIDDASARLEALIERLLDVSRTSVGQLAIELEDVDLTSLVEGVVRDMSSEIARSGSTVELHVERDVRGRWDRVRLAHVVMNLLSNALKYGAKRPIHVSVSGDDRVARMSVRDEGIGIALEAQARIFDRFERLGPVRHHGGFGLGLWLVRQIATVHGGDVTVASRPGEGAEFTVVLPLDPATAGAPASDRAPASDLTQIAPDARGAETRRVETGATETGGAAS
jgi:PAS domain S-box-containing protein